MSKELPDELRERLIQYRNFLDEKIRELETRRSLGGDIVITQSISSMEVGYKTSRDKLYQLFPELSKITESHPPNTSRDFRGPDARFKDGY